MHAAVSGQLGSAFLIDGNKYHLVTSSEPEVLVTPGKDDFADFYRHAQDLEFLESGSLAEIKKRLCRAAEEQDVLTVATLLMDRSSSFEVRRLAADALEKYLNQPPNIQFLEAVLFSEPVAPGVDLKTVSSLLEPDHPGYKLFDYLSRSREKIKRVVAAWDAVPHEAFHADPEKAPAARTQIQSSLVRNRWFFKLVQASDHFLQLMKTKHQLMQFLSGRYATGENVANVLNNWFRPLFIHAKEDGKRSIQFKGWKNPNLLEVREPSLVWGSVGSDHKFGVTRYICKTSILKQNGKIVSSFSRPLKLRHLYFPSKKKR